MKRYWPLIAIAILLVFLSLASSSWYWKKKYTNKIKLEKKALQDSLASSFQKERELIQSGSNITKKVKDVSKSIDEKLKADEKAIDDSTVTDAELDEFLTRYENH